MTQTSRKKKLRGIVLIPLVTMKPLNGEVKWNNIDLNQKWSGQRLQQNHPKKKKDSKAIGNWKLQLKLPKIERW